MAIPKETVEQIRAAANVLEVVGDFVQLKRRGTTYLGLCPFHNEKTPSFNVNPVKGIYKCFGCGKAGDSITFLMEHESLTYPEALKWLAGRYNIEIQEIEARPKSQEELAAQSEKEAILIALKWAADYFQKQLTTDPTGQAIGLSYFRERGFTDPTIDDFMLGYSHDAWDGLLVAAEKAGFRREILEKAGLLVSKEDGKVFDRFRGRVMFPIMNPQGKVLGFGARFLGSDKSQPKYLNSPETPVYHKSEVLYGLYQAKKSIHEKDNCYLCEGYTDVISLYQGGVKNAVASSGTAVTPDQIKLVARHTKNITVLYDGDAAGIKASLRGIDLLLEAGMNVRAVSFPEGEDPDSYMRRIGPVAFAEYLTKATTDFIRFKAGLFVDEIKNDPIKKVGVVRDIVSSIIKVQDPILRTEYYKLCSTLLEVDEQTLLIEGNKLLLTEQLNKDKQDRLNQRQAERRGQSGQPPYHGLGNAPSVAPAAKPTPQQQPLPPSQPPAGPMPIYDLEGNLIGYEDAESGTSYQDYDNGASYVPDGNYAPPADYHPGYGDEFTEPTAGQQAVIDAETLLLSVQRHQNAILLSAQFQRDVLRFLLEHATPTNPLGLELAQYFIHELEEVGFTDPMAARMFAMYCHEVLEGRLPTLEFFLGLPDREVANMAASLVSTPIQNSHNWKERHHILIPTEADQLSENAFMAVGALKLILKRAHLIALHDELKKVTDEDAAIALLQEYMTLKAEEVALSQEMNWVITDFYSGNPW